MRIHERYLVVCATFLLSALLQKTGSGNVFFYLIAVFSVLAALCWVVVDPARKIEEPASA